MNKLNFVIPKGRIFDKVVNLLDQSGIKLRNTNRSYRPIANVPEIDIKIMKPQNIPGLIELGAHDAGFTGKDWIIEHNKDVEIFMELGFDPVKIVIAKPKDLDLQKNSHRKLMIASEYERISKQYLDEKKYNYTFVRTYGATEVFPPEDADLIIDNTSTGQTLKENNLEIIDTIMTSSTVFVINKDVLKNPWKMEMLNNIKMLFKSILDARKRVMLEMNVPKDKLEEIVKILPCMRAPTISQLYHEEGYAVKTAVKLDETRELIPKLKEIGATDILEYELRKVIV